MLNRSPLCLFNNPLSINLDVDPSACLRPISPLPSIDTEGRSEQLRCLVRRIKQRPTMTVIGSLSDVAAELTRHYSALTRTPAQEFVLTCDTDVDGLFSGLPPAKQGPLGTAMAQGYRDLAGHTRPLLLLLTGLEHLSPQHLDRLRGPLDGAWPGRRGEQNRVLKGTRFIFVMSQLPSSIDAGTLDRMCPVWT